ncbi:PEP-CTERM sorting domain-containing protein [Marinobacter vulgaris]|nr:PEP-CTERM sorting domain-containing protein [Marinobacter vulgaris]
MKYMITGLTISMVSTAAMAGTAPPVVSVPEPGMLGLFAASVAAIFIAKKFGK